MSKDQICLQNYTSCTVINVKFCGFICNVIQSLQDETGTPTFKLTNHFGEDVTL